MLPREDHDGNPLALPEVVQMPAPPRRSFTVGDGIVLVAATAAAFALYGQSPVQTFLALRNVLREIWSSTVYFYPWKSAIFRSLVLTQSLLWLPLPIVTCWTFALAALRLVPPRPRLRRLARQPGTVACWAASFVLAIEIALSLVILSGITNQRLGSLSHFIMSSAGFRHMTSKVGFAVAAAWLTLALSGRWRAEPDWIDRAGRVLGAIWIALIPLFTWVISRG
jgi:hypothetical protein